MLLSASLRLNHTALTLRLAKRAGLPVQAHRKDWVEQGALFSYGSDLHPIGVAGARYVDSILDGTDPKELAVQEIPDVQLAAQPRDRTPARDQDSQADDHPGRQHVPVAAHERGRQRGDGPEAPPAAHPQVRRARRRTRRRRADHERAHRALLLLPGQQERADANPEREGALGRGFDRPVPERPARPDQGRRQPTGASGDEGAGRERDQLPAPLQPRPGREPGQLPRRVRQGGSAGLPARADGQTKQERSLERRAFPRREVERHVPRRRLLSRRLPAPHDDLGRRGGAWARSRRGRDRPEVRPRRDRPRPGRLCRLRVCDRPAGPPRRAP